MNLKYSIPNLGEFVLLITLMASCALCFTLVAVGLSPLFFNFTFADLPDLLQNIFAVENVGFIKYIQIFQSLGLFIVPAFLFSLYQRRKPINDLSLNRSFEGKSIALIILALLVGNPLITLTGELNNMLVLPEWLSGLEDWMRMKEESAAEISLLFLETASIPGLFLNLFMIAVIPAFGEEFIFRGIIQKRIQVIKKNPHIAIWMTAIIFSAIHLQFYGFIPRMLLGALFGYAFYWTGSLWVPIIGHFFNNAVVVCYFFIQNRIDKNISDLEVVGDTSIFTVVMSIFFLFFVLRVFYSNRILES